MVTVSGAPVSLVPNGSQVVFGGNSTENVAVASSTGSIGGAVVQAFEGGSSGKVKPSVFSSLASTAMVVGAWLLLSF